MSTPSPDPDYSAWQYIQASRLVEFMRGEYRRRFGPLDPERAAIDYLLLTFDFQPTDSNEETPR